jgi:hypothetical protein
MLNGQNYVVMAVFLVLFVGWKVTAVSSAFS